MWWTATRGFWNWYRGNTVTLIFMAEQLFYGAAFLRLAQLKRGEIQFSDATNAMRLMREHGRDVRYNAAWKKWLVWNGKYWEVDESGALVHEKGCSWYGISTMSFLKPPITGNALRLNNTLS